jgi:putative toxin-antitoxin system antitoxin component (TIGR02293 family)
MAQPRLVVPGVKRGAAEPSDVEAYWEGARTGHPRAYLYVSLLGLRPSDPPTLLKQVGDGLKFEALERFQKNTQFSTADLADLVAIRLRTLHRRKEEGRLEPEESDRLLRASRVFAKALELFEGDADAARGWLQAPAKALGGERPIVYAGTDLGSREVEALIDRLEHGVLT